ncbi:MAG TPA: helix-turn-helix domain-containing protein, partial [Candidatus Gracilibacteria bacterium]|nr:helix-turn-helix domain-containing protein [Candidatus Gracilibacteria bacterium]
MNEARVYLALVKHGPCNAGPLISETQLHRNIVYVALDHMIAKKYVTQKTVRGRKNFSVASPAVLENEFKKKAALASQMAKMLSQKAKQEHQEITFHEGAEEYTDLMFTLTSAMPDESSICFFGITHEGLTDTSMGRSFQRYLDLLKRKHMTHAVISNNKKKSHVKH